MQLQQRELQRIAALIASIILCAPLHGVANENHQLLWEISGADLDEPSYLYGTIHVKERRAFEFSDSVLPIFESCDAYAMEVELDQKALTYLAKAVLMDSGQELQSLYTEEEWAVVDSALKQKLGENAHLLHTMMPFFISAMLLQFDIEQAMDDPLDMYFYKLAQKTGKQTISIESIDEQIHAFKKTPLESQAQSLLEQLQHPDESAQVLSDLLAVYRTGDLDAMLAMLSDTTLVGMGEEIDILITDRNFVMADRIGKFIREQQTFVAIGAGHLPGDNGVIALLERQGYTLRPVRATFTSNAALPELDPVVWSRQELQPGHCSIEFPGAPEYNEQENEIDDGSTLTTQIMHYTDLNSGAFYNLNYTRIPMDLQVTDDRDSLYAESINGVAVAVNGTVMSTDPIFVNGIDGREARINLSEEMTLRLCCLIRGENIYQLMVVGETANIYGDDANRFLNSFRLTQTADDR